MFSAPGPLELIVILAVALIFLGPNRLPDAARSVGKGMREFRESLSGFDVRDEEDPYDPDELESGAAADDDDEDEAEPPPEEALAQDAAPVPDSAPERDS
jgi:sec-independent protein translocase protein TatA